MNTHITHTHHTQPLNSKLLQKTITSKVTFKKNERCYHVSVEIGLSSFIQVLDIRTDPKANVQISYVNISKVQKVVNLNSLKFVIVVDSN